MTSSITFHLNKVFLHPYSENVMFTQAIEHSINKNTLLDIDLLDQKSSIPADLQNIHENQALSEEQYGDSYFYINTMTEDILYFLSIGLQNPYYFFDKESFEVLENFMDAPTASDLKEKEKFSLIEKYKNSINFVFNSELTQENFTRKLEISIFEKNENFQKFKQLKKENKIHKGYQEKFIYLILYISNKLKENNIGKTSTNIIPLKNITTLFDLPEKYIAAWGKRYNPYYAPTEKTTRAARYATRNIRQDGGKDTVNFIKAKV